MKCVKSSRYRRIVNQKLIKVSRNITKTPEEEKRNIEERRNLEDFESPDQIRESEEKDEKEQPILLQQRNEIIRRH